MSMWEGQRSGLCVYQGGPLFDPVPDLNEFITISFVVNGKVLSFSTDSIQACSIVTMKYDGVDIIDPVSNHGRGIEYAYNALPNGEVVSTNCFSPTQQGSQSDGASQFTGASKSLYRAPYADGTGFIAVSDPAFWLKPNQVAVPSHPALNKSLVSGYRTTTLIRMNWNGNPNITSFFTDILVPDTAYTNGVANILDLVCCSYYAYASIFPVIEFLNPKTGALRPYPGFPATSNSETIIISSNDGSLAMATHQPTGEWGPVGYAQQITTAGLQNAFIRCKEVTTPQFISPGYRRCSAALAFGTKSQVISAVVEEIENYPQRTSNIVIPNLA